MILERIERERFAAYCDESARDLLAVIEQMKTLNIPEAVIKSNAARAQAYAIVTRDLRSVENDEVRS